MAESLDDCEFLLPPEFLTDDDILMDKYNNLKKTKVAFGSETDYARPMLSFEFPQGLGSFGVSSDLSSPVESVVGSTETESDEEDYLNGLTRQMAHSALDDDFRRYDSPFGAENSKGWFLSGSPQSTLCPIGSRCGCTQGSSRGSPNASCHVSSPPATWDLLYAAAGEVARMRKNEEGYGFNNHGRGLLGPPRKLSPAPLPMNNANADVGLYLQPSLSYQKLQASQFQQLRQQQLMKQESSGVWGGQPKGTALYRQQQTQPGVHSRGRDASRPLGLSASAWPPLQQSQQQQQRVGSGMRAVFLGKPGSKKECAGTGVFLPRRIDTPPETRKKTACSTVLLPAKVVQALNLNLEVMGAEPQVQHRCNGSLNAENGMYLASHQKRNLRSQPGMNNEIRLPQEWTY